MAMKVEIREFCGDWALDIHLGKETVVLYFNSRCNAELVKSVFEWEDAHPNEAIPYMPDLAPTLTPPNEPLTCEGCIHEHNEHENCNYCKRASYLDDYYYRRPPEGEEDT